jgi:hypothetical protein
MGTASYLSAVNKAPQSEQRAEKARSTAVPVMVMPDGRLLKDSWDIAKESRLPEIGMQQLANYDQELGPLVRQHMYFFVLKPSNRNVWDGLCLSRQRLLWQVIWRLGYREQVTKTMSKIFAVGDAEAFAECRRKLITLFEAIGERVRGRKGRFLNGSSIGIEDIALASLAAPMVYPKSYCEGHFEKFYTMLEAQDEDLRQELTYWRGTDVGKYVMQLYDEHRMAVARQA